MNIFNQTKVQFIKEEGNTSFEPDTHKHFTILKGTVANSGKVILGLHTLTNFQPKVYTKNGNEVTRLRVSPEYFEIV
jgi:hypothetical protein